MKHLCNRENIKKISFGNSFIKLRHNIIMLNNINKEQFNIV